MELAQWIRPGDGVVFGQASAEPQTLVEALVAQRAAYSGATLFMGVNWSWTVKPEHADHLRLTAYCGSGHNRARADAGVLDIHPHPYSQLAKLMGGDITVHTPSRRASRCIVSHGAGDVARRWPFRRNFGSLRHEV